MLTKIYAGMWIVILFAVGLFYVTGNLTQLAAVGFGFVCFGMVFMGMMSVLPSTVAHSRPADHRPAKEPAMAANRSGEFQERARSLGRAWFATNGVEVRKPKYP